MLSEHLQLCTHWLLQKCVQCVWCVCACVVSVHVCGVYSVRMSMYVCGVCVGYVYDT